MPALLGGSWPASALAVLGAQAGGGRVVVPPYRLVYRPPQEVTDKLGQDAHVLLRAVARVVNQSTVPVVAS